MGNIYVPIDFSNLTKFIPEGENIIYSTLCKADGFDSYTSASGKYKTYKFTTHVLMTDNGLAFNISPKIIYSKDELKSQEVPDGIYLGWQHVHGFGFKAKTFGRVDIEKKGGKKAGCVSISFTLVKEPNFETKETFKQRAKEFKSIIAPKWKAVKGEYLKKIYNVFDNNPKITYKEFNDSNDFFCDKMHFNQIKYAWEHNQSIQEFLETLS